jgi:hypothetical protein
MYQLNSDCTQVAGQEECYSIGNSSDWGGVYATTPGQNSLTVAANRHGSGAPWGFVNNIATTYGLPTPMYYSDYIFVQQLPYPFNQEYGINFAMLGSLSWTNSDGHSWEICDNVTIYQLLAIDNGDSGNLWVIGSNIPDELQAWTSDGGSTGTYLQCYNSGNPTVKVRYGVVINTNAGLAPSVVFTQN